MESETVINKTAFCLELILTYNVTGKRPGFLIAMETQGCYQRSLPEVMLSYMWVRKETLFV
jgi:hypothetical protein